MNMLEKILITGAMAGGLTFGANNYASAQNTATEDMRLNNTMYTGMDVKKDLTGKNIRGPPLNYRVKGDTIYIGLADSDARQAYAVVEFVAKPEEIDFIEQIIDLEIKTEIEYNIYFKVLENWGGGVIKASHLHIGYQPEYLFEAANAKKE